jgi:polyhydroxyalkanoate synthesis repressor PhaR
MANSDRPTIIIEKYANRRLYNTGTYAFVTLDELAAMVKRGKNFLVYDAKTGADITQSVLAHIAFEQKTPTPRRTMAIAVDPDSCHR